MRARTPGKTGEGGVGTPPEGWGRSLLPFHAAPQPPAYVEWGGEQVFPQPLQLQEVSFYSFMLDADFRSLRAVCDKYLNGPAGGRVEYHPLVPRVLLAFASIGRASCAEPPDSQKGWMSEVDVAFWVPVVAGRRAGPLFFAERVAWFLPYVFVNNAWASATGREIYGFPKEIGAFEIPASSGHPARLRADTLVLDRYHPTTQAAVRPIVEVVRTDHQLVGTLAKTWADLEEAFKDFIHMFFGDAGKIRLPGLGLVLELFRFLTHERVPMVFLKQFRDVADGRRSAYQAIVEAPARLLALREGGQLAGD